jgi:hypothetical protein
MAVLLFASATKTWARNTYEKISKGLKLSTGMNTMKIKFARQHHISYSGMNLKLNLQVKENRASDRGRKLRIKNAKNALEMM